MTSELPPEAHHYRKSQTPESPRPLHIPEPSNIPVLQNQMDPVFNDTTTYEIAYDTSSTARNSRAHEADNTTPSTPLQVMSIPQQLEVYLHHKDQESYGNSGSTTLAVNANTENEADSTNFLPRSSNATVPDLQRTLESLAQLNENTSIVNEQAQAFRIGETAIKNDALPKTDASAREPHSQPDAAERPVFPEQISGGVNYQSLLDTLSQSTATAPIVDTLTAPTTASNHNQPLVSQARSEKNLPVGAGLPPRPPPQEKPAIHPNYSPNESIRSYHQLPPQNVTSTSYQSQIASLGPTIGLGAGSILPTPHASTRAANGLPPPPIATFQQAPISAAPIQSPSAPSSTDAGEKVGASSGQGHELLETDEEEQPWAPEIQRKYDQFLDDERTYVSEGVWDRFPPGSRLFVGNLPTEKVTKRDLFHIFHRHGKLAQISLKQAYGFVQFLEAPSCYEALSKEQNMTIRGRKVHLEVSKPQKGSRNSGPADIKSLPRRRSRSPERRRSELDRGLSFKRLPISDLRDELARRRDDYRPIRTPSPRVLRTRDEHRVRERSPVLVNRCGRPRSPLYDRGSARFRSPSPRGLDDEAALPLPRRDPRDVPDVQILILEDVDQNFSRYIESAFKQKGLQAATIHLNPRITLAAVVKRQIIEGVQAVVKLTRTTQYSSRIPLQVFDRGAGATSVNFLEYVELDVNIAADIVIQARQKERAFPPPAYGTPSLLTPAHSHFHGPPQQQHPYIQPPTPAYVQSYPQTYPVTQTPSFPAYQAPHGHSYGAPNTEIPNGGGQNLQELLANLRHMPHGQMQTPQLQPSNGRTPDFGALIGNVARQPDHPNVYPVPQYSHQPLNDPLVLRPPVHNPSAPGNMLSYNGPPAGAASGVGQPHPNQNMQDIMNQLARWKQ